MEKIRKEETKRFCNRNNVHRFFCYDVPGGKANDDLQNFLPHASELFPKELCIFSSSSSLDANSNLGNLRKNAYGAGKKLENHTSMRNLTTAASTPLQRTRFPQRNRPFQEPREIAINRGGRKYSTWVFFLPLSSLFILVATYSASQCAKEAKNCPGGFIAQSPTAYMFSNPITCKVFGSRSIKPSLLSGISRICSPFFFASAAERKAVGFSNERKLVDGFEPIAKIVSFA